MATVISRCGQLPCDPCGPALTWTCRSWTATPSLVGWSGYDDGSYDAGDPTAWAGYGRKWRTRTLSGTFYDRTSGACDYDRKYTYTGAAQIDASGYSAYGTFASFRKDAPGCVETSITSFDETGIGEASSASVGVGSSCGGGAQVEQTTVSLTQADFEGCAAVSWDGTGSETLSDEDTIEDAIDRESPAEDDPPSCCAVTGVIAATSPESTSPTSVGESTRAEVDFTLTGEPSTTYTITLTLTNYVHSTGTPLADTTEDIEITTDGSGVADLTWSIPQPTTSDRRRCWAGTWDYTV